MAPGRKLTIVQRTVGLGDPHICTDDRDKLGSLFSIYESLVRRATTYTYAPGLAEAWVVDDGAKNWTFRLRDRVRFHDGSVLTSSDVIASLNRVRDPGMYGDLGTTGVYSSYLGAATLHKVSDLELQIVLSEPMADLLDLLVDLPIVPAKDIGQGEAQPPGTGPYRLVEQSNQEIHLEAFGSYWGQQPDYAGLVFQALYEEQRRFEKFVDGTADLVSDLAPNAVPNSEKSRLRSMPSSVCTAFMCNIAGGGITSSVAVRRALNYGLDVPALIDDVMPRQALPISGPLTRVHAGYDPSSPPYTHNRAEAVELLKQAGYGDGLSITLDVPTRLPDEAQKLAYAMAQQYREIGIDTVVETHDNRESYALMVREGLLNDAACFDSSPLSTFRVLREKFYSRDKGLWWLGYTCDHVDNMIEEGQRTVDPTKRWHMYRSAYRRISADAPWIYLYNQQLTWGVGPGMEAWNPPIDGRLAFS